MKIIVNSVSDSARYIENGRQKKQLAWFRCVFTPDEDLNNRFHGLTKEAVKELLRWLIVILLNIHSKAINPVMYG